MVKKTPMKKKVLMVIEGAVPAVGGGGAESQVLTLCYELNKEFDCLIVSPMVDFGMQIKDDNFNGVDILRIPYLKISVIGKLILLFKLALYLYIERKNYQIIHSHIAGSMSAVSSVMGYMLNKLVIVKMTGWTEVNKGILSKSHRYNFFNILNRFSIKLATHAQATSKYICNNLKEFGFKDSQILYLPNAVDTDKYTSILSKSKYRSMLGINGITNNDVVGLYVGRLAPEKGIYDFLKIWCATNKNSIKHKLIIIGSGVHEQLIRKLIDDNNLNNNIFMLGAQSDINKYTLAADFGVLPSMHEGLSNTLLEYMASSLPVIGTRVSGTEDLVKPGFNGWLFSYGDNERLNEIILELFETSDEVLKEYGVHSREYIEKNASIDVVTNKFKELYRDS